MIKYLRMFFPNWLIKQFKNFIILSKNYGQLNTFKFNKCRDNIGNEIPWFTYPATEYLSNIDFSDKVIFEYGSGFSSIFWSKKAKKVVSIEHDLFWFNRNANKFNKLDIQLKNNDISYENSIFETSELIDVFIIDGLRRELCNDSVISYIQQKEIDNFLIIFDNSDWYRNTCKKLREILDLIQIDFHGFGPINDYTWTTSIFMSRNYRFNPISNIQPHFSIASTKGNAENED